MATGHGNRYHSRAGRARPSARGAMADEGENRTHAMLSLAVTLPKVTRRTLGRHGLAEGGLVTDWAAIVGSTIAERSLPLRLSFTGGERREGTLHVRVSGALALELQHLEPQVLERINGYFGYRAVGRLRIHQGPVPGLPAPRRSPAAAPTAEAEAEIGILLSSVEDPDLREALRGLGRSLRSTPRKPSP
ncbi:MAG: DciA family protein [Rhodospirillales bacterium]|nr:DciA family protein [Rhodospirillales bacterium]